MPLTPALSILLAFASAIAAIVASMKATPIRPSHAESVRKLYWALEHLISEVGTVADSLSSSILKDGSLAPAINNASLLPGLQNLSTASKTARERLQPQQLLDFAKEEEGAAKARMWLCAAAVLALASAVLQVISLYR